MKKISLFYETIEKYPSGLTDIIGSNCLEKAKILEYLKQFDAEVVQARSAKDFIADRVLPESVACFTDGKYFWTSEEIYHFERYDLKLNADFLQYVLSP